MVLVFCTLLVVVFFACCEVVLDMLFDACSRILALHLPHLYCAVGSLGPSASELAVLIVGAECTRKYEMRPMQYSARAGCINISGVCDFV